MGSSFKILSWFGNVKLNINSDIAIITVKNVDYCCIIDNSKSEAINFWKNSVSEDPGNLKFKSIQVYLISLSYT